MSVQPLTQTLKVGVVLPQHKTARIGFTEPSLFTLHNICTAIRTDTNDFVFHKRIRSLRSLGGFTSEEIVSLISVIKVSGSISPRSIRSSFVSQSAVISGDWISSGITVMRALPLSVGSSTLVFLGALPFQKALLHQFFNGCRSGCRSADALTLHALRHTVCTRCLHS